MHISSKHKTTCDKKLTDTEKEIHDNSNIFFAISRYKLPCILTTNQWDTVGVCNIILFFWPIKWSDIVDLAIWGRH